MWGKNRIIETKRAVNADLFYDAAFGEGAQAGEGGMDLGLTTVFETFPFPWPPEGEDKNDPNYKNIVIASKELISKRDNWLSSDRQEKSSIPMTLTTLYNDYPSWLEIAHNNLNIHFWKASPPASNQPTL